MSDANIGPEAGYLSSAQVAQSLGVKQQTVYAYVSRGFLTRHPGSDGRTSWFRRSDVEQLRQRARKTTRDGELAATLATQITAVSDDGVSLRGHNLVDLIERGATFEAIAELLWGGPTRDQLDDPPVWPAPGRPGPERWPDVGPADRLRLAVILAPPDIDNAESSAVPPPAAAVGPAMIASLVGALPTKPDRSGSITTGEVQVSTSVAHHLWIRLTSQPPTAAKVRALDVALALLADHGLAASTLAGRVAASTRAGYRHVVAAALATLGGPLHGAASAAVHELYLRARSVDGPGPASVAAKLDLQIAGQPAMNPPGFGHAVYRQQDPRYGPLIRQLIRAWPEDRRLATVYLLRDLLGQQAAGEPNIDLALGALTYLADMEPEAGEVIFAVARTAGWLAHAQEEYGERPLRLRPKARYIGQRSPGTSP